MLRLSLIYFTSISLRHLHLIIHSNLRVQPQCHCSQLGRMNWCHDSRGHVVKSIEQSVPLRAEFHFGEDVTIRTICEAHEALRNVIRDNEAIILFTREIQDCDLSLVQLVLSARASALSENKSVSLGEPASGLVLEQLQRGGFLAAPEDATFWLQVPGEHA